MTEKVEHKKLIERVQILIGTDPSAAFIELNKLEKLGSTWSMVQLARMYETGYGVTANSKKCEEYLYKAYLEGSNEALHKLGRLYFDRNEFNQAREIFSSGIQKDYLPAFYWLALILDKFNDDRKMTPEIVNLLERASSRSHIFAMRLLIHSLYTNKYDNRNRIRGIMLNIKLIGLALWLFLFKGADERKS